MIYYIYEIPGEKNGATKNWERRLRQNRAKYGNHIEMIEIETMEGPDTEAFWQVVGDREWELADLNGYARGPHYIVTAIRGARGGAKSRGGGDPNMSFVGKTWGSINGKKNGKIGGKKNGSKNGKASQAHEYVCPHCNKPGKGSIYFRWHGDNCKHKKTLTN
jgi:hypothetical protein